VAIESPQNGGTPREGLPANSPGGMSNQSLLDEGSRRYKRQGGSPFE